MMPPNNLQQQPSLKVSTCGITVETNRFQYTDEVMQNQFEYFQISFG